MKDIWYCLLIAGHMEKGFLILSVMHLAASKNQDFHVFLPIDHSTVVCLVAWPLNENEAGGDLVLIETSLLFLCKFLLISMRTASLTKESREVSMKTRSPPASLSFKGQATKQATVKWSIHSHEY